MSLSTAATVVGIFEDQEQARQAIAALKQAGFRNEDIRVAAREWSAKLEGVRVDEQHTAEHGAVAGALVGGGLGAAAGLVGTVLAPPAAPPWQQPRPSAPSAAAWPARVGVSLLAPSLPLAFPSTKHTAMPSTSSRAGPCCWSMPPNATTRQATSWSRTAPTTNP